MNFYQHHKAREVVAGVQSIKVGQDAGEVKTHRNRMCLGEAMLLSDFPEIKVLLLKQ